MSMPYRPMNSAESQALATALLWRQRAVLLETMVEMLMQPTKAWDGHHVEAALIHNTHELQVAGEVPPTFRFTRGSGLRERR